MLAVMLAALNFLSLRALLPSRRATSSITHRAMGQIGLCTARSWASEQNAAIVIYVSSNWALQLASLLGS